jgi:hypothetical protein
VSEKKSGQGACFTRVFSSISNVLYNDVEVESTIEPNGRIKVKALWDTGASMSCICPEAVAKLNLKSLGKVLVSTPTDKNVPRNKYFVNLYLPNLVTIPKLCVVEGSPNNYDMLIGMDIIALGDFAVTNFNHRTMFSFRYPSMMEIDFVHHSYLTATGSF